MHFLLLLFGSWFAYLGTGLYTPTFARHHTLVTLLLFFGFPCIHGHVFYGFFSSFFT